VTVFILRKIGAGAKYYVRDYSNWAGSVAELVTVDYPAAVPVRVETSVNDEIVIKDIGASGDGIDELAFLNDGYTIVEDLTGQIYRVLQRYGVPASTVQLDKNWDCPTPSYVWVIAPPKGGGRYPCVGVFQKVIKF
jgi:hypothetical protein